MRRRDFITALGGAAATAAWPLAARAQQAAKPLQVGFLYPGPQAAAVPRMAAYLSGLQAGGFRAEESTLIPRVTAGNSALLAPMATELVASNVNLIMAVGPAAVRAAQAATSAIPIVANDLESDPVSSGFVASTARPGGNITGMFLDFPDFSKKWLEALKEGVPQLSNVAVLWDPATGPTQRNAIDAAAGALGLSLAIVEIRERVDFETAFQSATQQHVGGAVILSSPLVGANTKLLAELAGKYRLPAVALVIRRWRCLLSMILAGALSLATLALLISFGDQIHFQIMRQHYLSEIAQSNGANQRYWEWRGGLGWDEGVVFDRSDLALSKDDQQNDCKISNRPVAQHFYVQFVNCQ